MFIQRNFGLHDSSLVSCFLATNVAFCLLEPVTVRRIGLRAAVVLGAFAMGAGCALRYVAVEVACNSHWSDMHGGSMVELHGSDGSKRLPKFLAILGTMLVGAAQPFFQCTPSLLAANWFGENETTFAATVALNANQLGIAGAYAIGAIFVHTEVALRRYFAALALVSLVLAVGCLLHFRERPHRPPSYSALQSLRREAADLARRRCFESLREDSTRLRRAISISTETSKLLREPEAEREDQNARDSPDSSSDVTGNQSESGLDTESEGTTTVWGRLSSPTRSDFDIGDDCEDPKSLENQPLPAKLLRRWLVISRKVGHGALDITRDMALEIRQLARFDGFNGCLIAFVSSIVASNIFSAFLPHLVATARLKSESKSTINARIATLGSGFQVAIMAGSLCFGAAVDATKAYKISMFCAFVGTIFTLLAIADDTTKRHNLELAVLALGFFVGPIQP